jgi:hypothetical protein
MEGIIVMEKPGGTRPGFSGSKGEPVTAREIPPPVVTRFLSLEINA